MSLAFVHPFYGDVSNSCPKGEFDRSHRLNDFTFNDTNLNCPKSHFQDNIFFAKTLVFGQKFGRSCKLLAVFVDIFFSLMYNDWALVLSIYPYMAGVAKGGYSAVRDSSGSERSHKKTSLDN